MTLYLGLDIGGTKCAAVVGDEEGRVVARTAWASEAARGPGAMTADLIGQGQALMAKHPGVAAVGVAIGGPLDSAKGIIYSPPNLPGWDAVPLKERLATALGLPVRVEHDAAACALAEYRWGAGRGAERLAYLTCGTGFGVGLIFGGKIYRGAQGRPSDIGHIRYRVDGPTAYGKAGSWEAFAAGSALPKLAGWKFPRRFGDQLPTGQELAQMAAAGDEDAKQVIRINAQAVGDACALLADLLYLDGIVLGSLARYLGAAWLQMVQEEFAKEAYPQAKEICRIMPAGLGESLQDRAALVVAMP
ncbi:MAG: ROK family protein [Phycisphaeraceae bacterium]|nr:ROK family protein [Phycisphaeraceae bacterium]